MEDNKKFRKLTLNDNIDKLVNAWIEKWKNNCLCSEDLQNEWKSWLQNTIITSLENINSIVMLDTILSQKEFENYFVRTIEKFIFYGCEFDYTYLLQKSDESSICNKDSFDRHYYYFKCEECEEREVKRFLCTECFENSEHRGHKYKMFGLINEFCCCGENGTWDKTWYCKTHSENNDKVKYSLPENVESRACIAMEAVLINVDIHLNACQSFKNDVFKNDNDFCVTLHVIPPLCLDTFREIMERTLKPTKEEMLNLLSTIKNGNVTIKLSKLQCATLQAELKKFGLKFKAVVLHIYSVMYQQFVFNVMLNYLLQLLKYGREVRKLFAKLILKPFPSSNESLAEKFLIISTNQDQPLEVRDKCKKLLLFGVLKEYETKMSFGEMIIERYDVIIKTLKSYKTKTLVFFGFVMETLFTIPTLSHHLIANKNAVSIVLTTFLNESTINCNGWNNLVENWKYDMEAVNRSRDHLFVVRNLLGTVPKTWTKELRVSFLNSLSYFLQALNIFQYVDSETRQNDRHVEYERSNLPQLMSHDLARTVSLVLKWCKADSEILTEARKETLKMINQRICLEPDRSEKIVEFLNYSAKCLPYNAETQPVSIYLPLSRFLVSLGNIDEASIDSIKFALTSTFDSILKIHVMLAQFTAGMWKRNGNSVVNHAMFYRNFHRTKILDCDIQFLQIVASMTEPNKFLIQLLEKYSLIDWVSSGFEENLKDVEDDNVNQVVVISEQFLQFLIMVLTERYVPEVSYVTNEDCLQQEIIHSLCIKPSSHSELVLMESNVNETIFKKVLEEVSVLKKPASISGKGTYELKKEFFDRFNALYYHYNPEQMVAANEFQRQRRKAAGEPDCFSPSTLPKLKEVFAPMINIFQCNIMFHIIQTILVRFIDLKSKSYSETQLVNVLYLIGYALQEEQSSNYSTFSFTEKAAKWNLLDCLENLLSSARDDLPKDLLQWTIRKYYEVNGGMTGTSEVPVTKISPEDNINVRLHLAAARRANILKEVLQMQKLFLNKNLTYEQAEDTFTSDDDNQNTKQEESIEKTCILCQETQKLELTNEVLVMPGYVQHSIVLGSHWKNIHSFLNTPLLASNLGPAIYTSSCGHIMHNKCLQVYLIKSWETIVIDYSSGFNVKKQEFLCPLCKTLSNVILPVLPSFDGSKVELNSDLTRSILKFTDKFQTFATKSPLQVWSSLSYTIHVVETILRDANKPILGHLTSRHHECLENFVRIAQVTNLVYSNDGSYNHNWWNRILSTLLNGEYNKSETHLSSDIFSVFVTITFCCEKNLCNASTRFHTVRLIFVAEIFKILMSTNFSRMIDDVKCEEQTTFKFFLQLLGLDINRLSENFIWNYVQKSCLPFLRCCVLFHSYLMNDVTPPLHLTEPGGDTYSNMCSYLGFPQTREELFDMIDVYPHVKNWFKNRFVMKYVQNDFPSFEPIDPNHIKQLIELPHEYFDIIKKAALLICPNSYNKAAHLPHLCLVCGEMMCTGTCCYVFEEEAFCLPIGMHYKKCGSPLFLNVNRCEIIFYQMLAMDINLGIPGPYLDEYYEVDHGFKRANPLYLSPEKYKQLHTLWLSHGIFEKCSELCRKL